MLRWLATIAAVLVVLPARADPTGQKMGLGHCGTRLDNDGPFIQQAHRGCCSTTSCQAGNGGTTYVRWLRQDVAEAEGSIATIGDDEIDMGLTSSPAISSQSSSCFGKHFSGTSVLSTENLQAYAADVRDRVPEGKKGPILIWLQRWDLLTRQELAHDGPGGAYPPQASWLLRTDRTWANFVDFFDRDAHLDDIDPCGTNGEACDWSRCRAPNASFSDADSWDAGESSGCNAVESGKRLYDLLEALSPGLAEGGAGGDGRPAVYYVEGGPQMFSTGFVLADMLDSNYQDAMVELAALAMTELGVDGVDFPHKNSFFWSAGAAVQFWPDVPGDALGGLAEASEVCDVEDTMDSLAELGPCGAFSGPPERASGAPFNWAARSLAEVQIARKLYDRATGRVPYFRYVNPFWYLGCPKNRGDWDSAYADASCSTSIFGATELANLREIVQRAGYALIDLGGQPRTSGSIGSGAGASWSFQELKALIENPPGNGTPAPKVIGWIQQDAPLGEPNTLCRNPGEPNPESVIP